MNNWYDDAPVIAFHARRTPVAGKDHTCNACKKPIPKGTKHIYEVGREEGEEGVSTARYHFRCVYGGDE